MEIQVIEQNEITVAFNNPQGIQQIIDNIKSQVDEQFNSVVWDFTKEKDRKAVASMAYKVGRSKTAIDAEGKKLKEQYTVFTKAIDADRKSAREQLEAEQERIRKPLDDWEDAEKERVAKHEAFINEIGMYASNCIENQYTSSQINGAITRLESVIVDSSLEEFEDKATLAKYKMIDELKMLSIQVSKHEQHEDFLEKERIEEQQRIQQERDAQIAREATEKAQREAEEKARFEAERVHREKLEAEQREEKLKLEAEQALIREAQLKEQAEQQAKQAEIDKALSIERAEQAAKQAEHNKQLAIQAERDRIEREAKDKAEAELKEQQAREANKAHKKAVCDSILVELAKLNIDEATGQNLIKAIYNNQIPNISIKF